MAETSRTYVIPDVSVEFEVLDDTTAYSVLMAVDGLDAVRLACEDEEHARDLAELLSRVGIDSETL